MIRDFPSTTLFDMIDLKDNPRVMNTILPKIFVVYFSLGKHTSRYERFYVRHIHLILVIGINLFLLYCKINLNFRIFIY